MDVSNLNFNNTSSSSFIKKLNFDWLILLFCLFYYSFIVILLMKKKEPYCFLLLNLCLLFNLNNFNKYLKAFGISIRCLYLSLQSIAYFHKNHWLSQSFINITFFGTIIFYQVLLNHSYFEPVNKEYLFDFRNLSSIRLSFSISKSIRLCLIK